MLAVPLALAAGVKVSVPVLDTAGATEKSAALLFASTTNASVWPDSSAGPALRLVAQRDRLRGGVLVHGLVRTRA